MIGIFWGDPRLPFLLSDIGLVDNFWKQYIVIATGYQ